MKYYHATRLENVPSINANGLRASVDGDVHLTSDKAKAVAYVAMYAGGPVDVAVYQVKVKDEDVKPCYDGLMSGDDHYVYEGDIPAKLVKFVTAYSVGQPPPGRR